MDRIMTPDSTKETIIARDGTPIATYTRGAGAPLVVVQGTGGGKPDVWPAFSMLAERFCVTTMDRRGRGASGDADVYDPAREYEDVAAVVDYVADASGEPVNLLGHSFGGMLALEAALLTDNIGKLVLYEPALGTFGYLDAEDGHVQRLQALLDGGDLEGVVLTHYRAVGLTDEEIEQMKSTPSWQERLDTARCIPREIRAFYDCTFDATRFEDVTVPAMFLLGSDSPPFMKAATEAANAALPDSRICVLEGQEHVAMYAAPALFVEEVEAFLCGA